MINTCDMFILDSVRQSALPCRVSWALMTILFVKQFTAAYLGLFNDFGLSDRFTLPRILGFNDTQI